MGMLFQGSALFDSMNVGENTAFYLRQHDFDLPEEEIQNRVAKALDMVGLKENRTPCLQTSREGCVNVLPWHV